MVNVEFGWPIQLGLDVANIVTLTISLLALYLSFRQIRATVESERQKDRDERTRQQEEILRAKELERLSSAKLYYLDYAKLAFHNPKFSLGIYDKNDKEDLEKYDMFLSVMLCAFDDLIQCEPDIWSRTLEHQITIHKDYLRTTLHKSLPELSNFRAGYHPLLLKIVDEVFLSSES